MIIKMAKAINKHIASVAAFALCHYYLFVFQFMPSFNSPLYAVVMLIFHFLSLMWLHSMLKACLVDPGRVPIYFAFFTQEDKQRRKCIPCDHYQPPRTQHCTACGRCVLAMDHHCKWIGNCVGFTNRKFFILLLFYSVLTFLFSLYIELPLFLPDVNQVLQTKVFSLGFIFTAIGVFLQIILLVVIGRSFLYHLKMLLTNSLTFENEQRRKDPNPGAKQNFQQIFGRKSWTWLFAIPIKHNALSNGVVWRKNE